MARVSIDDARRESQLGRRARPRVPRTSFVSSVDLILSDKRVRVPISMANNVRRVLAFRALEPTRQRYSCLVGQSKTGHFALRQLLSQLASSQHPTQAV